MSNRISFPFSEGVYLDLNPALIIPISDLPRLYQLYAVCVHIGTYIASGHYDGKNTWLLYDDKEILGLSHYECKEETESTAYLLFYMCLHDDTFEIARDQDAEL